MGKVTSGLTMSLDGFIAGPNDGPENPLGENGMRLFDWYESGDTDYVVPSGGMTFKVSSQSAEMLRGVFSSIGAIVTGRRTFDITNGWGGRHPLDVPIVVLTHTVPDGWAYEGSPFTFVTDGVESAVERAREVAGEKDVAVGAASLVQQCLKAGLLDEVHVDIVPVLLGGGVRMFDNLGPEHIELERTQIIEAPDVTHMTFRVVKED
ncbi:MAG TPA: dihydrofolate reductase family protein [Rubrobacter sp.]|nr:dihydrofolate reductase family protein [Rubrobacter sp.]